MSWKLARLDEIAKAFPDAKLQGTDIRINLVEGSYELPSTQKLDALTFAFNASAKGFIEGYDAPADVDAAGVIGTVGGGEGASLAPPLVFGAERAWLKYAVEARVKADLGVELPYVSLEGSGDVRVLLADYHLHTQQEQARQALARSALKLRLPLLPESIGQLKVNDAMSFQARGTLKATVTLSWSDVFTTNMRALTELLSASTLVALKTEVGATLSATLALTDDYVVIFSRPEDGRVRVQVKKTVAREAGGAAGFKVGVGVADPEALALQLNSVLSALLATPVEQFEGLLDKLAAHSISPDEQKVLHLVLDRLGLEDLEANPEALRQKWNERKEKFNTQLTEAVTQKVEAGFTYEYMRTRETTTLLSAVCTDEQAKALHRLLLVGNLAGAIQQIQQDGITLEQCLLQDLTRRTQAWGFTLKLGKWEIGGSDSKELKEVVQRNSLEKNAPRRISFLGVRSYKGTLLKPYSFWTTDFKADMAEFRPEPTVADFDFGLYMLLRGESRKLDEKELRNAVDEAIVWRVLDDADEEEVIRQIRELAGDGPLETRVELKFGNGTMRDIFEHAGTPVAEEVFARALARALPWYSVPCRDRPAIRESVYAPLWKGYLEQNWSAAKAAKAAASLLTKEPLAGHFAYVEGQLGAGELTFAEVIQKNDGTIGKWRDLCKGLEDLHNGNKRLPSVIRESFKQLAPMWGNSFHLKASGAFFLGMAMRKAGGLAAVERTFTVVTPKGTQLVFTKSRS
jgi:hypothetical protein